MAASQSPGRTYFGLSLTELLVLVASMFLLVALFSPLSALSLRDRVGRGRQGRSCIWNVHAITRALRMYACDHDFLLPPGEHDGTARQYFNTRPGGQGTVSPECSRVHQANPYLRWPVILDSYLRARSVWSCPRAQLESEASVIIGPEDWLSYLMENEGVWGSGTDFCVAATTFPSGWGGSVTDSFIQQALGSRATGAFVQSIACNAEANRDHDVRYVPRPDSYVLVADGGRVAEVFGTGTLAYPDLCALECANEACGWVDWEECVWAADCGLYNHAPADGSFLQPTGRWARFAPTSLRTAYARHHGGVNLGFLDGHARWVDSEWLIDQSPTLADPTRGSLRGYSNWGPTSDCGFAYVHPGVPTLY